MNPLNRLARRKSSRVPRGMMNINGSPVTANVPFVRHVPKSKDRHHTNVKSPVRIAVAQGRLVNAYERKLTELSEALRRGDLSADEHSLRLFAIQNKYKQVFRRMNNQLVRLNERDPMLSMLFNRNAFRSRVSEWIRQKVPFTVIMLDIDFFKYINDHFDHRTGDMALRFFGLQMSRIAKLRKGYAARFGGEEFFIAIPGSRADAGKLVQQLNQRLETQFRREGTTRSALQGSLFTFSAGVSLSTEGRSVEDLIQAADLRLIESKKTRNAVTFPSTGQEGGATFRINGKSSWLNGKTPRH